MRKLLIVLIGILSVQSLNAQVNIGTDTLMWLQANIAQRSESHFKGQRLKTIFDSLYQLKNCIKEFNPPPSLRFYSAPSSANSKENDKEYLYVKSLTFYFEEIGPFTNVFDIQSENERNNRWNNTNIIVNTHVKYFKVVFRDEVKYPRVIAESRKGLREFTPFAEYFWSLYVVESVSVGEY
jgi:hypothetical protein